MSWEHYCEKCKRWEHCTRPPVAPGKEVHVCILTHEIFKADWAAREVTNAAPT
jgi:hypothetical protein